MSEAVCYCLVFADRVIREDNGKVGIIGSFSQFNFPAFPATANFPWVVFLGVTNLSGKHTISMNLVHDDTQTVVFPVSMDVDVPIGANLEFQVPAPFLVFNKEGAHTLTVNIDGVPFISRVLRVVKI